MNESLLVILLAMIVPAVAVIGIVLLERKKIPVEEASAEIVLDVRLSPDVPVRLRRHS